MKKSGDSRPLRVLEQAVGVSQPLLVPSRKSFVTDPLFSSCPSDPRFTPNMLVSLLFCSCLSELYFLSFEYFYFFSFL